ncbi:MAG: class I SAM-dependent methyltransferase [Hydrogenoanaerobacterium sp.]
MAYTCFATYYDGLTGNVSYAARAGYFSALIKKYAHDANILLDLACGTGSLSSEFLALGYEVIGVDISSEMLAVATQKAPAALFLCQDMTKLDLYGTVDVTVCALDSLNHLITLDALQKAVDKVTFFTAPDGIFIFDVNTVYKHKSVLADNTFFYENENCCCVWQNEYSNKNHIVNIELDFFVKEGRLYRRESESFAERAFTEEELSSVLAKAGLEVLALYEGDTFNVPNDKTERAVYVTRKLPLHRGGITANNTDTAISNEAEEIKNEHTRSIYIRRRGNSMHGA